MQSEAREIAKETAKTMDTAIAGLRDNAAEAKRSITVGEGICEVSNREGYRKEEESCGSGQNTSHRLPGRMGRWAIQQPQYMTRQSQKVRRS